MNATDFLRLDDGELLDQCRVDTYRSSGPGGQKKNKTSSAVRLHHQPTGLSVQAHEDRSQHVNKRKALKRLRHAIAVELIDPFATQDDERLTNLDWLSERSQALWGREDPARLEAINVLLTVLSVTQGHIREAADRVGLTSARFIKLLQKDRAAWQKANHIRQQHQLKALRRS